MKKIFLLLFTLILANNKSFAAKESIYTEKAPEPIGVYSQAIKIDNT